MVNKILHSINLIDWYILLTFVFYCFKYNTKNRLLGFILFVSVINEVVSVFLVANNIFVATTSNIYVLLHHTLWLVLLVKKASFSKTKYALISWFVLFGLLDFCFLEGYQHFNCATFIMGSLLYLVLFIQESFLQIRKDNLEFFQTNNFLLQFAPILFFLGLSFLFGFSSKTLNSTLIFGPVNLFVFISYFVNCIYYSLIIVYLYLEKPTVQHV